MVREFQKPRLCKIKKSISTNEKNFDSMDVNLIWHYLIINFSQQPTFSGYMDTSFNQNLWKKRRQETLILLTYGNFATCFNIFFLVLEWPSLQSQNMQFWLANAWQNPPNIIFAAFVMVWNAKKGFTSLKL